MKQIKIEVTKDYLEYVVESCKIFKQHGCTGKELDMLNKIINNTNYYLNKNKQ